MPLPERRPIPRRDLVQQAMFYLLCQRGKRISEINTRRGLAEMGSKLQGRHGAEPIWHTRADLIKDVAGMLRLPPRLWGSDRDSNEFTTMITQEISKLRRGGRLVDWSDTLHLGVFRLKIIPSKIPPMPELSMRGGIPAHGASPPQPSASPGDLMWLFSSIMTRGSMSSTYKFALARAMLDYCRDNVALPRGTHRIGYRYLAEKFLEYYWSQECKFRIKQNFTERDLEVVKIIRSTLSDPPEDFGMVRRREKDVAVNRIMTRIFGRERSNTSIVVPAFQRIPEQGPETPVFYRHSDDKKTLYMSNDVFGFFKDNYWPLFRSVMFEWTKFIEKANGPLPNLIAKMENMRSRGDLSKYRVEFLRFTDCCFYCNSLLERDGTEVDHFIPWSYMFDDDAWNLVLACDRCNRKKSNMLPHRRRCDDLISRNRKYRGQIGLLRESLDQLKRGRGWKREIVNHYDNCGKYGFGIIRLP